MRGAEGSEIIDTVALIYSKKGQVAHFASCGLMQKEIDFIEGMSATGGCPPLGKFTEQSGLIGV